MMSPDGIAAVLDDVRLALQSLRERLTGQDALFEESARLQLEIARAAIDHCLEALKRIAAAPQPLLAQVVLAAPDVDAESFKDAVAELKGRAVRYTLYGSEHDKALAASKRLRRGYPRAGDGGKNVLVVAGVETIDASAVGEDLFGFGQTTSLPSARC